MVKNPNGKNYRPCCTECGIRLSRFASNSVCPDCQRTDDDRRFRDYLGADSRDDYDDDPDAYSPSWAVDN